MRSDKFRAVIASLKRAAQLWHIAAVLAVLVGLEVFTGLPGPWLAVYPVALAVITGIGYVIYDREGGTAMRRTQTHHGNDMHGHY